MPDRSAHNAPPVLTTGPRTASHRPLVGGLISAGKRAMLRSLRWYTDWLVSELNAFGAQVNETLADLNEDRAETRRSLARIERRLQSQGSPPSPETVQASSLAGLPPRARLRSRQVEEAIDYLGFENKFRGSMEQIKERQASYVDLFRNASSPVVDLGCGRGEFLSLLREAGLDGYGVDQSADMIDECQKRGLRAVQADAIEHLESLEAESLGGIFSAQMVEHLDPADLVRLLQLAAQKLERGGVLAIETLNPQSLSTFTNALYIDLGHLRPLHPHTLLFLAGRAGFRDAEIRYTSPVPADQRLLKVTEGTAANPRLESLLRENFERIDRMLFGPQDFALVART